MRQAPMIIGIKGPLRHRAARPHHRVLVLIAGLALVSSACDQGGTYRPAPAPNPPPPTSNNPPPPTSNNPPPPTDSTSPPPANSPPATSPRPAECVLDADCTGALGDLGACAFAVCSSSGECEISNAVNGTPCAEDGCASGTCYVGDCVPKATTCTAPPPPPAPAPAPTSVSSCGDGVCSADEDCSLCPEDCGTCAGSCCEDNGSIGCVDPSVVDCVCGDDPYCCDTAWDSQCAAKVDSLGCGTCTTPAPEPYCGDGICDAGDTCGNCAQDCGACPAAEPYCGDTVCDAGDTCGNCAQDCGTCPPPQGYCGDGYCDAGDTCSSCAQDCGECPAPEPYCGDGYCDAGDNCSNCAQDCGECPAPEPYCGDGYCDAGDNCGNCAQDCGECPAPQPYCGDGYCDAGDTCGNCAQDCGACPAPEPYCGDGYCDAGDDCGNCASDCGPCEGACCEDNGSIGCEDPDVTEAVCDVDAFCCDDTWDDSCASLAESEGGAVCTAPVVCGDGYCEGNEDGSWCPEDCGELSQDCCEDVGAVGCGDPFIEQCVCDTDSYCCDVAWDETCAQLVDEGECGFCSVAPAP